MIAEPSTEELVRMSAEEAVARSFDVTNVRALRAWAVVTSLFALVPLFAVERSWFQVLAALFVLVHGTAIFWGLRPLALGQRAEAVRPGFLYPIARAYERSPRPLAMSLALLSFELVLFASWGTNGMIPAGLILGFVTLAFRLKPAERALLLAAPAFLFLLGAALGLPSPSREEDGDDLLAVVVNNALALGIGLVTTHRARRQALARFRLARQSAEQQLRMAQELAYAREIQLSMLPADCPPQGWLDVCSHSAPATEVGGDYYDYFELPDGRFAVVVGDVAGHGMASGLVLAGVRSCLILLAEELGEPLAVLKKLNRMVQKAARRRTLVTLAIAVFDRERCSLTLASAGHPPVLLRRAATGAIEELALPSLPLGTRLAESFREQTVALAEGDLALLSSDGIFEELDGRGEVYGFERLARVLATMPPETSADAVRAALLDDLARFRGTTTPTDDQTLVVVRVRA